MRTISAAFFLLLPVACGSDSQVAPPMRSTMNANAATPSGDATLAEDPSAGDPAAQPTAPASPDANDSPSPAQPGVTDPATNTPTTSTDDQPVVLPATPVPNEPAATPTSGATPPSEVVTGPMADAPLVTEEDSSLIVETHPPEPVEIPDCDNILEVTYRDFDENHEDFEMDFSGDVVRLQMVEPTLGEDGTPVFLDGLGCPPDNDDPTICGDWDVTQVSINSADSFQSWYHTTEGVNFEFKKEMELTETPVGSGVYVFDSTAFFPLEPEEGFGVTPKNSGQGKNFLFTTEMHLLFTYISEQTFRFSGDDDMWIFVNNKLALDLGSMHRAEPGEIDFDAQAEALGITPNKVYPMDIFHAERHTSASNFRIETNIGCFQPQPPRVVR